MSKRVCLYARVSRKEQDCARQLVELREIADNHGWNIVDEYIDSGISGATRSRPELDRMLKDAISRKFELVATLELSRLGRSVKICLILLICSNPRTSIFLSKTRI